MTREEARRRAEIMSAYANGKEIEILNTAGNWVTVKNPRFYWGSIEYRVKTEPTYRPFKDKKECWAEMLKHQPFGWVIEGNSNLSLCIVALNSIGLYFSNGCGDNYEHLFRCAVFADGTPFGIKED